MGQQADAMAFSETSYWQMSSIDTAVILVRSCHCSVLGLAEEGGRLLKQCRMRHRWKKGHVTSDEYVMTMSPKSSL